MFQEFLKRVARALDDAHIPYMVSGGQAVLLYGEPRLTREVEEVVGEERAKIEKTANINFDGRQYLIRFPKEISYAVGLGKEHRVKFTVIKPKPMSEEEPELTMEVVKDAT